MRTGAHAAERSLNLVAARTAAQNLVAARTAQEFVTVMLLPAGSTKTADNKHENVSPSTRSFSFSSGLSVSSRLPLPAGHAAPDAFAFCFALSVSPLSCSWVSDGIAHISRSLGLPESCSLQGFWSSREPTAVGISAAAAGGTAPAGLGGIFSGRLCSGRSPGCAHRGAGWLRPGRPAGHWPSFGGNLLRSLWLRARRRRRRWRRRASGAAGHLQRRHRCAADAARRRCQPGFPRWRQRRRSEFRRPVPLRGGHFLPASFGARAGAQALVPGLPTAVTRPLWCPGPARQR